MGHPAILDEEKLLWYNGQYIRSLSLPELAKRALPFLIKSGLVEQNPSPEKLNYLASVIALEQERIKTLADVASVADFFLLDDDKYEFDVKAVAKWFNAAGVGERLAWVREKLAALSLFNAETIEQVIRLGIEKFSVKPGEVIHPVRVAVSGRTVGPGLYELIDVLGRDRSLRRLDRALTLVSK